MKGILHSVKNMQVSLNFPFLSCINFYGYIDQVGFVLWIIFPPWILPIVCKLSRILEENPSHVFLDSGSGDKGPPSE